MPPKKEKPKGQSRPLGPIEYRYIPKLYFPLPTNPPPATTNVGGRPSNAGATVSPAQKQKEQVKREKTVEILQEMFRGRVEPELVETILSDCGWQEGIATDMLIKLSEGSDRDGLPSFDTQYHQAAFLRDDTDFRREIIRLNAHCQLAENCDDTDEYTATVTWATADATVHPTAPQLSHSASPSLRSLTLQEAAIGCSASDPEFVERTLAQAASRLERRTPTPGRGSSANGSSQMSPPLLLQPQQQQQRVRADDPSNDLGRRQSGNSAGTTPRSLTGAGAPFKNIASAVSSESLEQNAVSWHSNGSAASSFHGCGGTGNYALASPQLSPSRSAHAQQSQEQQTSLDVHYIQLAHGDIVLEKGTFLLQRAGSSTGAEGRSLSSEPCVPSASPAFITGGDRAALRDVLTMPSGGDLAELPGDGRFRAEPGSSLADAVVPVSISAGSSFASAASPVNIGTDLCHGSSSSSGSTGFTSLGSVDGTSDSSSSSATGMNSTRTAMTAASSGCNSSTSSMVTISSSTAAATASSADVSMASASRGSNSTSSNSDMDVERSSGNVTSSDLSIGCTEKPVYSGHSDDSCCGSNVSLPLAGVSVADASQLLVSSMTPAATTAQLPSAVARQLPAFSASSPGIFSLGASSAFMAGNQGQGTRSWSSVAGDCAQPPAGQTAMDRNLAEPRFRFDGGRAAAAVESSLKEFIADVRQSASRGIKILILMRGCPGSGKSTLARQLKGDKGIVLSTDDFFMVDGRYEYDSSRIGEAHTWNQKRAEQALKDIVTPVIIDNTNTMLWEMGPYAGLAIDHEYYLDLCEPVTEWRFDAKELHRKTSHGVPINVIEAMLERYEHNLKSKDVIHFAQRNRLPAAPSVGLTPRPTNLNNSSCTELLRPAASSGPLPPALASASVSLLSPAQVGEVLADVRTRSSSIGRHKMKSQTIRRNCLTPEVEKLRDKNVVPLQMGSPDTGDCTSPTLTRSHSAVAAASVVQALNADCGPTSRSCSSSPKAPVSSVANPLPLTPLNDNGGGGMLALLTPDLHQGATSGAGCANQAPSRPADAYNKGVAAAAALSPGDEEQQQSILVTPPLTKRMAASLGSLPAFEPIGQGSTEVAGAWEALPLLTSSALSLPTEACASRGTVAAPGDFVLAERLVRESAGPDAQAAVADGWRVVAASEAAYRQSHGPRSSKGACSSAAASAIAVSQQHSVGRAPPLRPAAIVCFDKSTMTDDDDPAGGTGVDGEQQLASLFPRVPAEYLRELLVTCKGNVTWATNTLLDSGYDEADFQRVPTSVSTALPVTAEAFFTGAQGTPHSRQSSAGTTPFICSSMPTHSAKRRQKKTYRMLSPQSWASFYLSPRPSDSSRGTHLCRTGSCGHPEHRADFARAAAAAASGSDASDFVNVTLTLDSVLHLAELFGSHGNDQGTGIAGVDLPAGTAVDVKLSLALAHELHCAIKKTVEATRASTAADEAHNATARLSVAVFPARSPSARPPDANALGYCELERTIAQTGSPNDSTQQPMSDADLARLLQYEDTNSDGAQLLPPPLYEIMDAQLAEQLEHEEQQTAFGGRCTELSMAERLRRQQLYYAYPNEKIEVLNATFDDCGRNPLRAMDVLGRQTASTGDHSSPAAVAASVSSEDFDDEWEDVPDDPGNRVGTCTALTVTGDQLYQQSRSQANFHLALKKECQHKAMLARSKGPSAAATVAWYTQQARSHAAESRHCHRLAASRIFHARNESRQAAPTLNPAQPQSAASHPVVELHGLHAGEAVAYLRTVIGSTRAELARQPDRRRRRLTVITGKGSNSRGGVPRVKQAVMNYLQQKEMSFTEINEGVLQVSLYRSDAP